MIKFISLLLADRYERAKKRIQYSLFSRKYVVQSSILSWDKILNKRPTITEISHIFAMYFNILQFLQNVTRFIFGDKSV